MTTTNNKKNALAVRLITSDEISILISILKDLNPYPETEHGPANNNAYTVFGAKSELIRMLEEYMLKATDIEKQKGIEINAVN